MDPKELRKSFDSFLDEKLLPLGSNVKIAILVAALALPLALFYFLLYSPKQEEITALEGNKANLEREIAHLAAKTAKLDKHKAEMAAVDRKFKIASQLIPDQKEIPSLLTSVSGLATNSGLHVLSFTPGGERPGDFYAEIPVSLSVKGSYHNFGHFLYQVSQMPRIALISNISLGSATRVAGEMQLGINFHLTTYRFIEPKEANGTQK